MSLLYKNWLRWCGISLVFPPLLAACATLPDVDPRAEYAEAVKRLKIRPVYPPRQDFRVGSVYYFTDGQDSNQPGLYLGYLPSIEKYAENNSGSGFPAHLDRSKILAAGKDLPFSDPAAVPLYSLPSITVSAATAVALGGTLPQTSRLANFGRARKVTIGFQNTRRFGLAEDNKPPTNIYDNELANLVRQPGGLCDRFPPQTIIGPEGIEIDKQDLPWLRLVTAVILSDRIVFTSNNSRVAGAAIGAGIPPGATAPAVNLNVSIPANASAAEVQELLKGVSSQTAQTGAAITSSSGSTVAFDDKPLGGYVAIAYSAFDVSPDEVAAKCSNP